MTDRSRLTALAAIAVGAWAAAASAQAQPRRDDHHRPPPAHRPPPPPRRPPPPPRHYHRPPPPGYAVGRRVPREYLGYNYRIDNWNYYHLPPPRRNHYWVQYGADYVMVSPSGIVVQIWGR